MNLFKPQKLDYLNLKKELNASDSEIEQIQLFISFIIFQNKKGNHEFYSKFLYTKIFTNNTSYLIQKLVDLNIIDRTDSYSNYSEKKFCKKYEISDKYFYSEKFITEFKFKSNIKKYENLVLKFNFTTQNQIEIQKHNKQIDFINKLVINKEKFNEVCKNLEEKYKNTDKLNSFFYIKNDLINFKQKNDIKIDNHAGRIYNIFTNKRSDLRDCFELNGTQLSTVDIKSSQLFILSQLNKFDLTSYSINKNMINIDKNFIDLIENKDLDFYNYISEKLKISRKECKKLVLTFLFGGFVPQIYNIFKNEFKNTLNTIMYLQSLRTKNNLNYIIKIKMNYENNKKI